MRQPRGSDGFTLVEVLVALIVLAVAVVAALQLFGGGLRLLRASSDHLDATLLASEKLGELGLQPVQEGVTEGTEGDYRWTLRVTPEESLNPVDPPPATGPSVRLARVILEVRWGRNGHVELVTLRALGEGK